MIKPNTKQTADEVKVIKKEIRVGDVERISKIVELSEVYVRKILQPYDTRRNWKVLMAAKMIINDRKQSDERIREAIKTVEQEINKVVSKSDTEQ
jgi:hypothetical protein